MKRRSLLAGTAATCLGLAAGRTHRVARPTSIEARTSCHGRCARLGDVPAGDILIQIGRIADVGASLQAEGAALIDGLDPQEVNK